MPGSSHLGKHLTTDWFIQHQAEIKTVLDVGPGWGTYYDLFSPLTKNAVVWESVEIWEPYVYRFKLYDKYSAVYVTDISSFVPSKPYDLIIFGDILEHLTEQEAIKTLNAARTYARYYIISLPLDGETHAHAGTGDKDWDNPYELHKGQWSSEKFLSLPFADELIVTEKFEGLGVYVGKSKIFKEAVYSEQPTPAYIPRYKLPQELWHNRKQATAALKRMIPKPAKRFIKKILTREHTNH